MQHIKYNNRKLNHYKEKRKDKIKQLQWAETKLQKITSLKSNKAMQREKETEKEKGRFE